MTFADEESLLGYLSRLMLEEHTDFVAYLVISHWHAMGVDALVHKISQNENRRPSGIVVVVPHQKDGFVIGKDDFVCQRFATVEFCYLDLMSKTQKTITSSAVESFRRRRWNLLIAMRNIKKADKGNSHKLRIASLMYPSKSFLRVFRNKRLADRYYPVFSLLDEGLASYMTDDVWELISKAHTQWPSQRKGFEHRWVASVIGRVMMAVSEIPRSLVARYVTRYIDQVAEKCVDIENLSLFQKQQGGLVLNEDIANSYKYIIEERGKLHEQFEKARPLAIVLTQPFSEYEQVTLACELDIMEAVIAILVQTGFDVLAKPHPREVTEKYLPILTKFKSEQVTLVKHKMPVEELFSAIGPDCVVGYTSTALAVASTVFDIPAITIVDMLLGVTDDEYIKVHGAEFKILTREIVYNADTIEKLANVLRSIASNTGAA